MSTRKSPIVVALEFDPQEMSRRGRIGAHRLHALYDSKELTAAARAALATKFEREVDPDGTLSPEERARRAAHARKAYFCRLGRLSAQARAKKRATADPNRRDEMAAA